MAAIRTTRGGETRRGSLRTRILVAIEELELSRTAALILRHGGYDLQLAESVEAARQALDRFRPQLMLLDVDAADGRAIELISESETDGRTPIIALTRRADLRRQLEAFDRGADDVIGIPFAPADLAARVHAVLRRTYGKAPTYKPLRLGELEVDLVSRNVVNHGVQIHLSALEQALLYLLASNAGTTVTRDRILDAVWGDDFLGDSNIIERHVRSLRAKLQNDWRNPKYIETVAGAGYRFVPASR